MPRADESFPAPEPDEQTLTVREVGERVQALLAAGFPRPFWMVGETSGLERTVGGRSPHWYFTLVDDGEQGDRRPSLNVKMWRNTVQRLFGARGSLRGQLDPADGIVLRVLVRPDFWLPRGEVSFIVEDVDPEYTLGTLDRQRRELLARLQAEGTTALNKVRPLPEVPLRLGLVTSVDSAAHHDVLETLRAADVGFSVLLCDARTQGEATGPTVCAALATLGRRDVDAILLVRGGGSRLDLSWFDREDVARAIAACPVPVLTGIGHEIDLSVADAVAHQGFKTPTAVAEFLVDRARRARDATEDAWARIEALTAANLDGAGRELRQGARALRQAALAALDKAETGFRERTASLRERSGVALQRARDEMADRRERLVHGRHVEQLARLERRLGGDGARLELLADRHLERATGALSTAEERCRLLDPRSVLARGYAWLRRPDGRLLKDAAGAVVDEPLTAVLRDGEVDARVVAARARRPGRGEAAS